MKKMPHADDKKYIATTLALEIKDIERPIGMIVLKKTKAIIISEQGRNQVTFSTFEFQEDMKSEYTQHALRISKCFTVRFR